MLHNEITALVLALLVLLMTSTCRPAYAEPGIKTRSVALALRCRALEAQGRWAQAKVAAGHKATPAQYAQYQTKLLWYNTHCR